MNSPRPRQTAIRFLCRYFIIGLIFAVVGGLASLLMPDLWVSEGRILPKRGRSNNLLGSAMSAASALGLQVPGQDESSQMYLDVLNSRWMSERILKATYTYETRGWRYAAWRPRTGTLLDYFKVSNADKGRKLLLGSLQGQRDMRSDLLTITFTSRSPQLSQQVVRLALANLNEFFSKNYRTQGEYKAAFLKERLATVQGDANEAEQRLKAFLNVNRNDRNSLDPQVRLTALRLEAELQVKRQVIASVVVALENALSEAGDDRPVLNVLDSGNLPLEKDSPVRKNIVIFCFLAGAVSLMGFDHRKGLAAFLRNEVKALGFSKAPDLPPGQATT